MKVVWHPLATAAITEAARHYAERQSLLGSEFLDEIDRSIETIILDPTRFAVIKEEIRLYAMRRFPYGTYFRVMDAEIRILIVKHHSRDPDHGWERQ